MANRNVDLLIRARDDASRAFKSVSEALGDLGAIQEGVAAKASKVDAALGKSQSSARDVAKAIGGDLAADGERAAKVFERIERTVSEASAQFEKQKADLRESGQAYAALKGQAEAAAAAIRNAENKIGPQTPEQVERLKAMQAAYRDLTREVSRTAPKLSKQEAQLEQSAAELDRIRNAAIAASSALREVARSSSTARGVGESAQQQEAANAAARRGLSQLAKAEREVQIEIAAREEAAREAARAAEAENDRLVNSVREVIQAEERLAAIEARRASIAANRAVNRQASAGLAGITAGLMSQERAEVAATKAAEAHRRAMDTLSASYAKQRAQARPSVQSQRDLAQSFRTSFAAAQNARRPIEQLVAEIVRLGPATDSAARGVQRLSAQTLNGRRAFAAFYGDSRRALSLMQRLRGEVLSLTASFVGFYGVFNVGRGIFEAFTKLEAAQNRLGAAFDQDYAKVNAEMAALQDEAGRLGISFDVLADNYSKFLISGQQAGLETAQLREVFRQVSEAGRVLKLSNDQIAGTFNALTQIAGKGTLQMEELRQQLGDRLPGAVGLLANALGYGEDELAQFYKDVENGAISAEQALVGLGKGLEDTYGGQLEDALDSTITKVGELQNLFFQRQATAANAGFIDGLDTALDALNEFLASEEGIEFFEALGAAFGRLFELLPAVIDNLDLLTSAAQVFVAIKLGQVVSGLAGNLGNLTRMTFSQARVQVALNRTVAAFSPSAAAALRSSTALGAGLRGLRSIVASLMVTMRAAFLSIGGIVGIAAAALSFFALEAVVGVDDSMSDLEDTMRDAEDVIGDVAKAFRDAGGDADKFAKNLKDVDTLAKRIELRKLQNQITDTRAKRSQTFGVNDLSIGLGAGFAELDPGASALRNFNAYIARFNTGKMSAKDMQEALGDLSDEFDGFEDIAGLSEFKDYVDQMAEAEEQIARLEAELAVIDGTATDAQRALLGLDEQLDESAAAAKRSREQFEGFQAAMRTLGENIPELNEKLEQFDAIRQIEEDFQAALAAADGFADAAERAARIGEAVELRGRAYDALYDGQVRDYDGTDGTQVAAQFLRDLEGFRATPYWDVNANRVGFGSDTVTLADGTIKKVTEGMRISVADANRDLMRRITTEFMPAARRGAGAARFDSFNAQQQAALTSIAYNYGSLPDRIIAAVRNGTDQEIAAAIKGLANDNEGINRQRRLKEAALFTTDAGVQPALDAAIDAEEDRAEAAKKLKEDQDDFRAGLVAQIEQTRFLNSLENERMIDAEVAKAIREAEIEAQEVGLQLTKEQRAEIEAVTRAKFATAQAEEDRNDQLERAKALEEQAALLAERRRFLLEQITQMEGQGDMVGVARTQEELEAVEAQLESALEKAIAFWEALGGEGSEKAILALQTTQQELRQVESTAVTTGRQINDMIADRAASAFDSFSRRVAEGENALDVFKQEFMRMAADILIQIGQMIIRQSIFNAISGMMGGGARGSGGLGGLIAGGVNGIFHNGGVATGNNLRSARTFDPAIFANARRYHTGGIAGLAPDEMGAILKKNEEILTEQDPRHRFNGGLSSGGGDEGPTIINAFDAEEMLERALATPRGKKVMLNHVRATRTETKAALG
jgi:tape measure domain-containing protein